MIIVVTGGGAFEDTAGLNRRECRCDTLSSRTNARTTLAEQIQMQMRHGLYADRNEV